MTAKKTAPKKTAAPTVDEKPETKPQGRPSIFTQEMADLICDRMADGESLRSICSSDNMPRRSTVFRWLAASEQFRDQYAHACELRTEELFDQLLDIADTPQIGQKTKSTANGVEITEGDMIEHRRLQVEARKWALSKMAPKKYSDKLAIGGADDLPPIKTMTDSELDAAIAAAQAASNDSE